MPTKNLVPRANGEGGIGTGALKWGSVHAVSGSIDNYDSAIDTLQTKVTTLEHAYAGAKAAATVADMTDHNQIYVYVGSESGYTNGNWYYWNGTAWTSGGVYNATALETDKTLTVSGAAADSLIVGNVKADLQKSFSNNTKYFIGTESGYVSSSTGTINTDDHAWNTGYIDIRGYRYLQYYSALSNLGICVAFFDSNKKILRDISIGTSATSVTEKRDVIDLYNGTYFTATYVVVSCYSETGNQPIVNLLTLSNDILFMDEKIDSVVSEKKVVDELMITWESGGISGGTGELIPSSEYSRTIDMYKYPVDLVFSPIETYKNTLMTVIFYSETGEYIIGKSTQGNTAREIYIPANTYFKFAIDVPIDKADDSYTLKTNTRVDNLESIVQKTITDYKGVGHKNISASEIGYCDVNGLVTIDNGARNTGLIPVKLWGTLTYTANINQNGYYVAFYDKEKKFISDISIRGTAPSNPVVSHGSVNLCDTKYDNAYYVVVSFYLNTTLPDYVLTLSNTSSTSSCLNGKIINAMGDSITSTNYIRPNWWEQIASRTGATFNNYGQSGTTLAHTDERHLWDFDFNIEDATAIGYDKNDPSTWETGNCFVERVDEMNTDADGVIVMGGTNDASVHRGSWNSTDTSTFFGALNVLFTKLQQTFAGKPILVCTMIQSRDSYSSNVADPLNVLLNEKTDSDTLSLQLRAEAIKAKAHQYGIPCLDLFNESGISGVDFNHVYYNSNDTLHPSSVGQKRMASLIQNKLESLFIE